MVVMRHLVLATTLVALARAAGAQSLAADDPVRLSLGLCDEAGRAHGERRAELLEQALELARIGVETDPEHAEAHYAVFCALGRQLDGHGVSVRAVIGARRVRRALDRVLELDPDHVDALVGKARMLRYVPDWLGGDPVEARRCLERARALAPNHPALRSPRPDVQATAVDAPAP